MNFRVIEPHADDAFLSVGWHIKHWVEEGHNVEIVTVYSTEKRCAEAKAYADKVGAKHTWLGLIEAGDMDGEPAEIPFLLTSKTYDCITLCPLGLRHTEHYAVRSAWSTWQTSFSTSPDLRPPLWYYVDQPYALQLKNQKELREKIVGKKIQSIHKPGGRKYDKKTVGIFKTQSLFFFYNKDVLPHAMEILVS